MTQISVEFVLMT